MNFLLNRFTNTFDDVNNEVDSLLRDFNENTSLKDKMMNPNKAEKNVINEDVSESERTGTSEDKIEISAFEKRLGSLSN